MKHINVVIIAVGNISYKRDAKVVLDDYFNFYNVNPVYIEQDIYNPKNAHPSWLKMISYEYLDNTDPVLCWDLDLLPVNRSINIFEYINTNKINMCVDNSVVLTNFRFNQNFRYNGGLISFPYSYKDFFSKIYYQYAPGERPSYEQYYLNDEIINQKINIHELPLIFNGMLPPQGVNANIFNQAFCRHYTWGVDGGQKTDLIAKHKSYYFNNLHT